MPLGMTVSLISGSAKIDLARSEVSRATILAYSVLAWFW